jgi:O-6-methylguanine DNA methyltransferase
MIDEGSGMAETIHHTFIESPWCELTLASSRRGVCVVSFVSSWARARESLGNRWSGVAWKESRAANYELLAQLREYFRGRRRRFKVSLDLRGTTFQLRAWRALTKIPFGQTRTYQQLAQAAGSPQAFRAAGLACHDNPVAIVVPCHRVVGSNGSLTGFGGGLNLKRALLAHESARRPGPEA